MCKVTGAAIGLSFVVALCGCKKKATPSEAGKPVVSVDACTLLTGEEVQAVQGSPVTDTKSSDRSDGIFRISQCYYFTVDANRSASLVVTQRLGPDKRSPGQFWKETFGRYDNQEEEKEAEEKEQPRGAAKEEEHEKAQPPKKVEGLGDSAYWTGDRVGGALYVLKNDSYIRISVGGRDTDEGKIEKTKALAAKVLSRF